MASTRCGVTAASSTPRRSAKTKSDPAPNQRRVFSLAGAQAYWWAHPTSPGRESHGHNGIFGYSFSGPGIGLLPQRSRHPRHHLPGCRRGPDRRLHRLAHWQHRGQPRSPEQDDRFRLPLEDRRFRYQLHALPLEPDLLLLGGVPRRHQQHDPRCLHRHRPCDDHRVHHRRRAPLVRTS